MRPPQWTRAEIDFLDRLAGNVPRGHLLQQYNAWASDAKMPPRSHRAIETKLSRLSISAAAIGDVITPALIAQTLGARSDTVRSWLRPGGLPAIRCGWCWYVRRRDLVAFARRRPDLFRRFPMPRLVVLLEDRKTAEAIAASRCHLKGLSRRVVAVETGTVYPSISAAAKSAYYSPRHLRRAIQNGQAVGGYHWRWYDQQATPPQNNG